jgi:hypothetical protein
MAITRHVSSCALMKLACGAKRAGAPGASNYLQRTIGIVGPRPHAVALNEEYRKLIKRYMVRFNALPGITGLAKVRSRELVRAANGGIVP